MWIWIVFEPERVKKVGLALGPRDLEVEQSYRWPSWCNQKRSLVQDQWLESMCLGLSQLLWRNYHRWGWNYTRSHCKWDLAPEKSLVLIQNPKEIFCLSGIMMFLSESHTTFNKHLLRREREKKKQSRNYLSQITVVLTFKSEFSFL